MSNGKKSRANLAKSRPIVMQRDNHTCIVQDTIWSTLVHCGGPETIQHRVNRGMGSSSKYDEPQYLLIMCSVHNTLAESSYEFADFCERNGYKVRRHIAESTPINRIPVRYGQEWFLLDGHSKFALPTKTAEDLMYEIYAEEKDDEQIIRKI